MPFLLTSSTATGFQSNSHAHSLSITGRNATPVKFSVVFNAWYLEFRTSAGEIKIRLQAAVILFPQK
jgi:hypothetical protein